MYNKEIKEKFLVEYNNSSVYKELFEEVSTIETELEKDLFDFNYTDFKNTFENQEEKFELASRYFEWACCQGHTKTNVDVASMFLEDEEDYGDWI